MKAASLTTLLVLAWPLGAKAQAAPPSSELAQARAGSSGASGAATEGESAPGDGFAAADDGSTAASGLDAHSESWAVPSLHALGLMTGMRLTEAYLWPDPFAETDLGRIGAAYEEAYTRPPKLDTSQDWFEWDGDPWQINVVGHALFGSELYLRARTCKKSALEALAFTAAGAVVWDYVFEANGVRPSALDLVYTPLAGIALGETRLQLWRIASRVESRGWRSVLTALLDPLGELERTLGTPC